jgi:hypothetical protein
MILFWFLWVSLVLGGLVAGVLLGLRLWGWKLRPVLVPVPARQRRGLPGPSPALSRSQTLSPPGGGLPSPRVVTRAGPGPGSSQT